MLTKYNNPICGCDPTEVYDRQEREAEWRSGIHTTRDGKTLQIRKMNPIHLENTIKCFRGYDVSPLRAELKRRVDERAENTLSDLGV